MKRGTADEGAIPQEAEYAIPTAAALRGRPEQPPAGSRADSAGPEHTPAPGTARSPAVPGDEHACARCHVLRPRRAASPVLPGSRGFGPVVPSIRGFRCSPIPGLQVIWSGLSADQIPGNQKKDPLPPMAYRTIRRNP